MSLTKFLLARIAEDEAALDCGVNSHDGVTSLDSPTSATCECDFRGKREVKARRRIVDLHDHTANGVEVLGTFAGGEPFVDAYRASKCAACGTIERGESACPTLRALALPYADHPGYREEWRP